MTKSAALGVLLMCVLIHFVSTNFIKAKDLAMLAIVGFTGNDPRDGYICKAAMEVALDAANAKSDFLPKYRIRAIYKDEGANANFAVRETIAFQRDNNLTDIIPMTIGPFWSGGCQRLAGIVHHLDFVTIGLGCAAAVLTSNRVAYPNLYRIKIPAELVIYSRLLFVRDVGKWDRVGILTSATNPREVSGALTMQDLLIKQGIAVPWFGMVVDIDASSLRSFRLSDLRVILVEFTSIGPIIQFFCAAYTVGVTGKRYAFIMQTTPMFDPTGKLPTLPVGCSREILIEQFKQAFFVGAIFTNFRNMGTTSLGYDLPQFDERLSVKFPGDFKADFMRHMCHDGAMIGLLSLDAAEKKLNGKNLTLADFATNKKAVSAAINESLARLSFSTLHAGQGSYSASIEIEEEPQAAFQWTPTLSFQMTHWVTRNQSKPFSDPSTYRIQELIAPIWMQGKPPISFPLQKIEYSKPQRSVEILIKILAGLFSAGQLVIYLLLLKNECSSESRNTLLMVAKLLNFASCIVGNVAAVAFIESSRNDTDSLLCKLRVIASVIGLSLLNGSLCYQVLFIHNAVKLKRTSSQTKNWRRSFNKSYRPSTEQLRSKASSTVLEVPPSIAGSHSNRPSTSSSISSTDSQVAIIDRPKRHLLFFVLFLTTNWIILIAWMASDAPVSDVHSLTGGPVYDSELDAYHDVIARTCVSQYNYAWMSVLGALQAIVVIVSLITVRFRASRRDRSSITANQDLNLLLAVQVNSATLVVFAVLIALIVRHPTAELTTLAVVSLAISLIASLLTYGRDVFRIIFKQARSHPSAINE